MEIRRENLGIFRHSAAVVLEEQLHGAIGDADLRKRSSTKATSFCGGKFYHLNKLNVLPLEVGKKYALWNNKLYSYYQQIMVLTLKKWINIINYYNVDTPSRMVEWIQGNKL